MGRSPEPIVVDRRFEVGALAGRGGMGHVHRALDRATGSAVAFKTLTSELAIDRARFEREASLLASLSHEAIVCYVAHGVTPSGAFYLVMEWIEGGDLHARLASSGMSVPEVLALAQGIASAIGHAHAKGIVHRDIKPSNVLLVRGACDRPKLADFGIARPRTGIALTRTGQVIGTPGYMAPEQARSAKDLDERADVFALGCLTHHALTGRPPFDGDDPRVILAKVMTTEPARIGTHRTDVPPALEALVDAMLQKDPACRPSAENVCAELRRLAG